MATEQQNNLVNSLNKGMVKDTNDTFTQEGTWSHARNAVNNAHDGELGVLGNEPANLHCVTLPYDLIGAIHLGDEEWAVFTTDDVDSEIGIFNEGQCSYQKVVNSPCLNFKRTHLITGASRRKFDCGRPVYWADGLNPDRYMDLDDVPYKCYPKQRATPPTAPDQPQPITDLFSYTVQNKSVPEAVISGSVHLSCSDNGCTEQGSITATFTLDQPAPAGGLRVLIGHINESAGAGKQAQGMDIFAIPAGVTPMTYYANPSLPFEVVIPEGLSTFTTTGPIYQVGMSTPGTSFICHNCLFPITELFVKSGTAGYKLQLSETQSYTLHNMDVVGSATANNISFNYKDTNNAAIGPVTLKPGESRTVCAKEGTVVLSDTIKGTITKGVSCAPAPPPPTTPGVVDGIGCVEMNCTDELDCEQLRLAPLLTAPCLNLQKGSASGTLPNGSYQVAIAYTINGIRVTDYFLPSNVQSLFSHANLSGSLEAHITTMDQDFEEFELVVISYVNQQTVAKRLGVYSTRQKVVYIDTIDPSLVTIPLNLISLRTPAPERSDAMFPVNNYLLRSGIYSKFAFNYQQQANKIRAKWVAVKYAADYYHKGGHNASYMRDEQYAFFIRWIYNTGEKSASFHIPGRAPKPGEKDPMLGVDAIETLEGIAPQRWQVENTATITALTHTPLSDGGIQIAEGEMGYWQSSELYPDNKHEIWGDLCGLNIRHHKFPDNSLSDQVNHFTDGGQSIVVMGVKFEGITHPLDNKGNPMTDVVGYEILRGSREGQKTIVAKGMLNNMREYNIEGNADQKGLYANYPYNDLRPDYFHTTDKDLFTKGPSDGGDKSHDPLSGYRKDIYSFHSPETTFMRPYLNTYELKVYQELQGKAEGNFEYCYKHPKMKMPTKFSDIISKVVGAIAGVGSIIKAIGGASDMTLKGSEGLPMDINLLIPKRNNYAIGNAAAMAPNPAIMIENGLIAGYNAAVAIAMFTVQTEVVSEHLFTVIYGLIPKRQFALQYNSHGFYDQSLPAGTGERRRKITDAAYISSNIQSFSTDYRVNNLYRPNYVILQLQEGLADPALVDKSRNRIKGDGLVAEVGDKVTTVISSRYGALKINLPSQYGQLDSIKQIPVSSCVYHTVAVKNQVFSTGVLFGGDVYINRFTEKNTMLFFSDWLMGQPDEYEYDYRGYTNIPYPRYWIDSERGNYSLFQGNTTSKRHLNARESSTFYVKKGYFYISCNGVRDFFVESEINLAQRDWEEEISKRHYDPYAFTDIQQMFRSDVVKSNNYYKYDYSLSVGRMYHNYFSWGEVLARDYDPQVAESCYIYAPHRVIYSLPQQDELKKDNWRIYLVNNYKDFTSRVTHIKSINKSGALILFNNESPVQFMGVDSLETDAGTKITIGDGGLFNQPLQNIMNADGSYQYGACQSRMSALGTPYGVFWVSQEQGKIFQYGNGAQEITRNGNKFWFAQYLPSQLQASFPEFDLYDNPLMGSGVQAIYDNTHEVVYFCKKDYAPLSTEILYDTVKKQFYVPQYSEGVEVRNYISLNDTDYFEDISWTASYDPKSQMWISLHDWHPTMLVPAKSHFLSVKGDSLWRHNSRCDLFCNFYGQDFPFEVEMTTSTGPSVETVRNMEYLLECYRYDLNCRDRHHILDENFDQALVWNSEQISGMLNLKLKKKNAPQELLAYPKINANSIDIQFSKEEHKYRFNQFWDITRDRGEFTTKRTSMFLTKGNGYTRTINPQYIDYRKSALERKKFRHYSSKLFLRKLVSGSTKMLLKLNNTKIIQSAR